MKVMSDMSAIKRVVCVFRFALSGSVLALTACSTPVTDFSVFRELPLAEAEVMPTPEQVKAGRTKVILLDMDDQDVRGRMADASALQSRKLEEVLAEGGVEVVDRRLAGRLRQEIALAEARGDGSSAYTGPEVANFAIRGFVSDVGASSRFTPPSEYCDKKGKCTQVQSSCTYNGTASGGLRVYELPSLKLVNTFNLRGSVSQSGGAYCQNDPASLSSVARAAVEDAVYDNRFDLKTFFASKGYIAEKRVSDRKVIFKVLLGRSQGIRQEDKVTFFSLRKTENRLLRKVEFEEIKIMGGEVLDGITDEYAWVVPDDASKIDQVRLGDYVRVQYKKGFFD